jgi:hypothetical protein
MSGFSKAATCRRSPDSEAFAAPGLLNVAESICAVESHSRLFSSIACPAPRLAFSREVSLFAKTTSLYFPLLSFICSSEGCDWSSASARCFNSP